MRSTMSMVLISFALAAAAAAQTNRSPLQLPPPTTSPSSPQAIASDAPIGPRDVLDIRVFQDEKLNTVRTVGEDGNVTFPPIGKVPVGGLTPLQAEQRIKGLLEARFFNKADVTVELVEAGSRPISVVGAVMKPGRIGVTGNITLIQAITTAGGLAPGYGKTLYVLRTALNGLSEQIGVDIEDLMVNGNPDLNLPLRANDVINIPVDTPITIYVMGEVMRPGTVQFRSSQRPTIIQALAGAGGLTDRAGRSITLKRFVNGEQTTKKFDYRKLVNGSAPDVQLMDSDTLIVNESFL